MKRVDVITIGSATQDIFVRSSQFRVRGDATKNGADGTLVLPVGAKVELEDVLLSSGGGATNAAATFVQFRLRTHCIAKVGDDASAAAVLHDLRSYGVPTAGIVRAPHGRTAFSVILSMPDHGRTILVFRGSGAELTRRDVPLATLQARWLYVTSLGGDLAMLAWLVATARRKGIPVACNPGVRELASPSRLDRILRNVNLLFLNREEAQLLVGTRRKHDGATLARTLGERYGSMVVITDGARGATAFAADTLFRTKPHRNIRVAERTGAGDAFGSGFIAGLLREHGDPVAALQYATANAESVITEIGAKNGLLRGAPNPRSRVPVIRHFTR